MFRKIVLIILLCVGFIHSQNQNQLFLIGSPEIDRQEIISKNIKTLDGKVCSGIIVLSNLFDLSYQSSLGIVKRNSFPGKDFLFVSPDENELIIYCLGYAPLKVNFRDIGLQLISGQVWSLKLSSKNSNQKNNSVQDYEKGSLVIETMPEGATVTIDELPYFEKLTPVTLDNYPSGSYSITIKAKNYRTIDTVIEIEANKVKKTSISLPIRLGIISVNVTPDNLKNVEIRLNDAPFGYAPIRRKIIPGDYILNARLKGYNSVSKQINIKDDETTEVTIEMKKED